VVAHGTVDGMAGLAWIKRTLTPGAIVPAEAPAPAVRAAGDDVDLAALVRILARQWLLILVIVGVCVGGAGAYVMLAPKTWKATARLLLDPRDKQVVGPGVAQPVIGTDPTWVDTQASIVLSEPTLRRAVDALDLAKDPELGGTPEETLHNLADVLAVERADQTYVLEVSATTRSPERSARIAQAVADAFVASIVDIKADAIRQATDLIGGQIDDLRDKARQADLALQEYKRANGIVSANGRMMDEEQLRQVNDAYVAAAARTQETKSRLDSLASALAAGGTGFTSALDSVNSAVISRLKIEQALASKAVAELAGQLGPSHPRMVAAQADVERTRTLILEELRSLKATAKADYDLAVVNQKAARATLDAATETVNRSGVAGVRLRELENEATVRREMYRGFVSRMQQTALQTDIQISDARVIVPALPPKSPATPRRTMILALAGVAGLGLGLSAALFRGRADLLGGTAPGLPVPARTVPVPAPEAPAQPAPADAVVRRRRFFGIFDSRREDPPAPAAPASPESRETDPDEAEGADEPLAPVREAPIRVLAEVAVDTRASAEGRSGRPLARSPQEVAASLVELSPGRAYRPGEETMAVLAETIAPDHGGPAITVVFGTADAAAVAAVSFGLARGVSVDGGRALLVDAAADGFRLAAAFMDEPPGGIVDVIDGGVEAEEIVAVLDDGRITVIPAVGARRPRRLGRDRDRIAGFVEALSDGYDHTVVHLGADPDLDLLQAMADASDAAVLVADRGTERSRAGLRLVRDLAALTPAFAGVLLVEERFPAEPAARADATTAAA
jgi:uncharacterized protein involved in exopolysaccharide biosynthesis/Mrp family chromosome partitioning ATPase